MMKRVLPVQSSVVYLFIPKSVQKSVYTDFCIIVPLFSKYKSLLERFPPTAQLLSSGLSLIIWVWQDYHLLVLITVGL